MSYFKHCFFHNMLTTMKRKIKFVTYVCKIKLFFIFGFKKIKTSYGIFMSINHNDKTFQYCVAGLYGRYLYDLISKLKFEFYFIDIGANQGLYSICAAKNPHCQKVFLFEPQKKIFKILKSNLLINKVSKKCNLFNKAIYDRNKIMHMGVLPGHSGSGSILIKRKFNEKVHTINHINLDLCIKVRPGIPIIVKIDTEGTERVIINQLSKSKFFKSITKICYESNDENNSSINCKKILKNLGFAKFYRINSVNHSHHDIIASKII